MPQLHISPGMFYIAIIAVQDCGCCLKDGTWVSFAIGFLQNDD
jgi:hypothetical protein